ncbi:MAG: type II secretion system F family protein [Polyangia bacterium]
MTFRASLWERHPLVAVVRLRQRLVFCRSLLALVKAGVPMTTALADMARVQSGALRAALRRAGDRLRAGTTLAEALDQVGALVDPATRALLAGGAESGRLEQTLGRRVQQLEEAQRFVGRMLVYFIYPLYLLAALVLVGPLLSLPAAVQGGACTGSLGTIYLRNMLGMAGLVAASVTVLLALPLLVAVLGVQAGADRVMLRMPVFGRLYRDLYGMRLAGGLSTALAAGVEVIHALRLAGEGMSSPSLAPRIGPASDRLAGGGNLTEALAEFGVLDAADLGQVVVAERTGNLDVALDRIAQELSESVLRRARLAAFLVLGLLVAGLLAVVVVKMLGVIFGPINRAYQLPDHLDRL